MTTTPDPRTHHVRAAEQMARLIAKVRPDQLGAPTPCGSYDVGGLLAHIVAGTHRLAHVGEGGAASESPAEDGHTPDEGWPAAFGDARRRFVEAWDDDARLDDVVSVPWGDVPGRIAVAGAVMESVTHAWDLARALDREGDLDPELSELALGVAHEAVPAERRGHSVPFAPAVAVGDDADASTRLAAWLGRRPDWTAA